ncbi:MAG: PHP domain-containing protein [Micrococcales bacterium]|nr:PHP domain-containing protein [Micrococcales bacterium]
MLIDLHTHSTASDGTDAPQEVMAQAAAAGLDVVALTDHDTTIGWSAAAQAALEHGIDLIPGMEISCTAHGVSVHLLSYLHDPNFEPLLRELTHARESRRSRARRIVDRLAADMPLTWDDVAGVVADGATVGRPHIADAMVARGIVADRGEAFTRYLHNGSRYYASHYAIDVLDAVRLVRLAGGVPVIAHPFAALRGRVVSDDVIEEMAAAGLVGIEAHHLDHTAEAARHAEELGATLGLVVTGSSDFHGDGKPNRLADRTTRPEALERILSQATGTAPILGRSG